MQIEDDQNPKQEMGFKEAPIIVWPSLPGIYLDHIQGDDQNLEHKMGLK